MACAIAPDYGNDFFDVHGLYAVYNKAGEESRGFIIIKLFPAKT